MEPDSKRFPMMRAWTVFARAAAFACIACVVGLFACSNTTAGSGNVVYAADGPVYNFGAEDAGQAEGGLEAAAATAAFSTYYIDFGQVGCNTTATATEEVVNEGLAPLVVSAATTGTAFSVSTPSVTVPVNGNATIDVIVTVPGSAAAGIALNGTLTLTTNDPTLPSASVQLIATPLGASIALKSGLSSVNFPESEVGENVIDYFVLVNNGNGPASVAVAPPSNPLFSIVDEPDAGVTLNPGATWTGSVEFTATDTTLQSAVSTVAVDGATCGGGLTTISLTGQGATGALVGWPTAAVDFGPAPCGGAAPAPTDFVLTNTSGVDVRIESISITPADSGFATDAQVGEVIAANGGERPITVTAPAVPAASSALTPITATLAVQSDADASPHILTLREEPQGAVLAFSTSATPNFGSFGGVVLLDSATESFSVTNTGSASAAVTLAIGAESTTGEASAAGDESDGGLDASDATLAGPPPAFAIADSTFTLGPTGTQTDAVTFTPPTGGSFSSWISMSATGAICSVLPQPLAVSGTGLGGGPSIAPTSLSFSATCGGGAPATQLVSVSNDGTRDMTWAISAVTGPGAAQYAVHAAPGLLVPSQTSIIEVSAAAIPSPAPNADPSSLVAEFTITTDVPLDSPHVIALSEVPIGDRLSFSVSDLRFGQFPIDHVTPPEAFSVANAANAGSQAANVTLTLVSSGAAVYVEPEDGGAVCVVPQGDATTGEGGPYCPAAPGQTDAGDGSAASGASEDTDSGAEYVLSGFLFPAVTLPSLSPSGGVSPSQIVTFVPTAPVSYSAAIAVQTSDPLCSALPPPLLLTGTGTQGQVTVSPATLALGTDPNDPQGLVNCGSTGLTQPVTIANTGNQSFNITGLSLGRGASSPFSLSGAPALPVAIPIGGSLAIPVAPLPIPSVVANPNDPSPFSDTLTVTTDAAFDAPHTIALVMQARGAVIADRTLDTSWDFGTITLGSIGTIASAISNTGNAPASVSLQGLTDPTVFGLQSNPTLAVANGETMFIGQFVPPAPNSSWTDEGTLVVTATQAFCQPLPAAWTQPQITLYGASNDTPAMTISGSLAFPSAECGSAPPPGQTVTIANDTDQTYAYTLKLAVGTYYAVTDAGPGTIAGGGGVTVVITPVVPAQGLLAGAAPYADTLVVSAFPAGADAASPSGNPAASTFTVPISWTVNGAVFSLPEGAGPSTDGDANPFYPADTTSGLTLPLVNTGNEAASISFATAPSGVVSISPAAASVPPEGQASVLLTATESDALCPATTNTSVAFFYAGSVCQPLALSQVLVEACQGTLQ